MKRATWVTILLGVIIVIAVVTNIFHRSRTNTQISAALQTGKIEDARMLMQNRHDLQKILAGLSEGKKAMQAALDVQFEYAHVSEEDTNYAYPEDLPAIKAVVEAGAKPEFRHLLTAAEQGKMKTVDYFMSLGVPIQQIGASDSPLSDVAYYGDASLLKRMIEAGADVNFTRSDGWTPLLGGAWSGEVECVKILLEHGADIDSLYTVWEGNRQPVWKVIEERATHLPTDDSRKQVWRLIAEHKKNLSR